MSLVVVLIAIGVVAAVAIIVLRSAEHGPVHKSRRECPACGWFVERELTECPRCEHDFASTDEVDAP